MPGRNGRVARRLVGVAATMLCLSFAAVPFYDWFCRVTGYGGTTTVAAAPEGPGRAETVTVRFDASSAPDMSWVFRPMQRTMEVRLGESALAFYEAYNPTDEPVAGTASYNVTPHPAGPFFAKIACFCFELQVLQPGERIEMPVSFFVDAEMLDDADAGHLREITLSYTMFRSAPPEQAAAAGARPVVTAEAPRPETVPAARQN